ncbi:MAG: ABC-F family ATP-binding cassette domain-containing protein [Agrococcus casei]|uniref:ABC-F family ATP-binding cassette domain-containing protein n=1 Tax=Agrococcus casei TaxID=343512 RepID=UPI003F90741A
MSFVSGGTIAASAHISVDGVSLSFAGRRVLTDISFSAASGSRTGLIGENGSGKSTLLNVIAGDLRPDSGTVSVHLRGSSEPSIGMLRQEPEFAPGADVRSVLDDAVARIRAAGDALETAAALLAEHADDPAAQLEYAAALDQAERLDPWGLDARIERALSGLGLGGIALDSPVGTLSGGQRSRTALAALLLGDPDVLLLDEPTNHLDDAASAFLAGVLRDRQGPVVMASHDRAFLDDVATGLIDLDPSQDSPAAGMGVTRFTGTYTAYLAARADARARWQRQHDDEQAQLRRLRAGVSESQTHGHPERGPRTEARASKKFYADRNAKTVARRVNDVRAKLDRLEQDQIQKPPSELSFAGIPWRTTSAAAGPVLTAADVAVEGRLLPTTVSMSSGEHLLVTGANGSGKPTLLHVLAGRLQPTGGSVQTAPRQRIGLLSQDAQLPDPHERGPDRSAQQAYEDAVGPRLASRVPLADFGLLAERNARRPVAQLSRGQVQRVALAAVLAAAPDVLLLDEPTNHLSLLLVTQLEEALVEYPGVVVVASHDRWLRERWHGLELRL